MGSPSELASLPRSGLAVAVGLSIMLAATASPGAETAPLVPVPAATSRALLASPQAKEQPATVSSPVAEGSRSAADGRRTLGRLPVNIARGFVAPWAAPSLVPLLIGATATGIATAYDEEVRDWLRKDGDPGAKAAEDVFGAGISSALLVATFAAGRFAHAPAFRDASYDLVNAAVVTLGYTLALKAAAGRERPNGSNNQSFPSGHTSNAWSIAAVLDGHYGKMVAIPAYTVAALVGVARIRNDKHWLSDVVAGGTVGFIVGHSVVRVNNRPLGGDSARKTALSVAPILGSRHYGVAVSGSF